MRIFGLKLCMITIIMFFNGFTLLSQTVSDGITLVMVDPLDKILKERTYFPQYKYQADVARGEEASFQFVFRNISETKGLKVNIDPLDFGSVEPFKAWSAFVAYVQVGRTTPTPSKDKIHSASGYYPDPLIERETTNVPAFDNQPVWISIHIPADAKPGEYETNVIFSGISSNKAFSIKKPVKLHVYNVTVRDTRLFVTNWFFLDQDKLKKLNEGTPVKEYSDQYWDMVKMFARFMKQYRQNVMMISPLHHARISLSNGNYVADFSNFDKAVEIFFNEGGMKRIEGAHFGGRLGDWESNFGLLVPVIKPDTSYFEMKDFSDELTIKFYNQFIPQLVDHLKQKGWWQNYMQHIADEPIASNVSSYQRISEYIHKLMPGVKVIEANHSSALAGSIDVWVPQLNFANDSNRFYQERKKLGEEIWFYTCLAPQGNYPNRFVELPLIQTRYLHWMNYRFGYTGYLHWGLNYWNEDPFGDVSGIIEVSCNTLPGGDSHIIYPGYRKLFSSMRMEAMRDGIVDYELLSMLEARNPEQAREIAKSMISGFQLFDGNIKKFREKRKELLQRLNN